MKVTEKNIENVKLYIKREVEGGKPDINYFRGLMKLANENSARACYYTLRKDAAYINIFRKVKAKHDFDCSTWTNNEGGILQTFIALTDILKNYTNLTDPNDADRELYISTLEKIERLKALENKAKNL